MPSEWSHCDGAVAISKGLPTFVVADRGVEDKGIAYAGGGRYVLFAPPGADATWVEREDVRRRLEDWFKVLESQNDVFFGYCSSAQATADSIIKFLTKVAGVSVKDWAVDFSPGKTILTEITEAAESCRCGIFLFTKDDLPKEVPSGGGADLAYPRDNVILEAGYFLAAKGKDRVLIVREDGAKMPADLGGDIYVALKNRADTAGIETKLRQFLTVAL